MHRAAAMLVLSGCLGVCVGEGILPQGPLAEAVTSTVKFTTNLAPPENPFASVSWNFISSVSLSSVNIITSTTSTTLVDPAYENRISFDRATGGLELRNLVLEDSGEYTLTIIPEGGQQKLGKTTLKVLYPITGVSIERPTNPSKEGIPYTLTCTVTGSAEHVSWLHNGVEVREGDAVDMANNTITFNPLHRNDTGYYKCTATNALGSMISPPQNLLVNFGPDTPVINGPAFAETGQRAVFNCSAMSVPPSQFSWWFNGTQVASSSVFITDPMTFKMSGEYKCMAYNEVMGKNSANAKMVTVIEAIESVMIINNTAPINSENFTLTCQVIGPYDTIYWTKDNVRLNGNTSDADAHMYYHMENNTLHFTPVTITNDGTYQCFATNKAGQHGSPHYMLLVNYGPLSVNITGPYSAKPGVSVSLRCSADSQPTCDFKWFFNNTSSAVLETGSVLTIAATKESAGDYICEARNPVTNITMYTTKAYNGHVSISFSSRPGLILMGLLGLFVPLLFI